LNRNAVVDIVSLSAISGNEF